MLEDRRGNTSPQMRIGSAQDLISPE